MKLKIWLDSGANIYSKREVIVSLEDIGLLEDEWKNLSHLRKEQIVREIAFENSDWGWEEVV